MHSKKFSIPLTVALFWNENLEKDRIEIFDNEIYKTQGFFIGEQKVSMVDLRGNDDELFSVNCQRFIQLLHSTVFDNPEKTEQAE